ncbi:hypothetical protein BSIN_2756 [Burkholderia singularis]|uniref:Uncharacterized protein n=1 Tax=Burkholderia singularis TaxID=1503053 RepID=A0A238H3F8_9BURK|nr:hypothetical protein BSIN_2756 [Burkholderia singularis]
MLDAIADASGIASHTDTNPPEETACECLFIKSSARICSANAWGNTMS